MTDHVDAGISADDSPCRERVTCLRMTVATKTTDERSSVIGME